MRRDVATVVNDVEAFADRGLRAVCCGQIPSTIIDVDTPPQQAVALMKEMTDGRPR